jgi:hypothetical protein
VVTQCEDWLLELVGLHVVESMLSTYLILIPRYCTTTMYVCVYVCIYVSLYASAHLTISRKLQSSNPRHYHPHSPPVLYTFDWPDLPQDLLRFLPRHTLLHLAMTARLEGK